MDRAEARNTLPSTAFTARVTVPADRPLRATPFPRGPPTPLWTKAARNLLGFETFS